MLRARERLQQEAEAEFAQTGRGVGGRSFLDVTTIRQILVMRDDKRMEAGAIEKALGLKEGVVKKLGKRGIVSDVGIGKVTGEDSGIYG